MKNLIEYIFENINYEDILDIVFKYINKKHFSVKTTGNKAGVVGIPNAKLFSFDAAEISKSYIFDNLVDKLKQEWKSKGLQFNEIEQATNQKSLAFSFNKQDIRIVIYSKGIYVSSISIYIEANDKNTENIIDDFIKTL